MSNMNAFEILVILFAHFVGDFILQSDKQAINKSTSNKWLTTHVLMYGLSLLVFSFSIFDSVRIGIIWVILNTSIHWGQDFATSRLNKYLRERKGNHWFFIGIGADQFIHFTMLILTYSYL